MPQHHRTVDRLTTILEEAVHTPGMTFAELTKSVSAPKSSVHGFVRGLLATGWLHEEHGRFRFGPAAYGLTLAGGLIPAGLVTRSDLDILHRETGLEVFLGVLAGDHLIYISTAGSGAADGFEARSKIRRAPLATAGGKALLAQRSDLEREAYLRRRSPREANLVRAFLQELEEIRRTQIATNSRKSGKRLALATTVHDRSGEAVASITLVGQTDDVQPRQAKLGRILTEHLKSPTSVETDEVRDRKSLPADHERRA